MLFLACNMCSMQWLRHVRCLIPPVKRHVGVLAGWHNDGAGAERAHLHERRRRQADV